MKTTTKIFIIKHLSQGKKKSDFLVAGHFRPFRKSKRRFFLLFSIKENPLKQKRKIIVKYNFPKKNVNKQTC